MRKVKRRTFERLIGAGTDRKWRALQDYSTPRVAIDAVLDRVKFQKRVWEPCMGLGAISKRLVRYGHRVYNSDIKRWKKAKTELDRRRDFLKFKRTPNSKPYDIVTNPPYADMAVKIAVKGLELLAPFPGAKMALLLKIGFLEGVKKQQQLFSLGSLRYVYVFSYRIPRMHRFYYKGPKATSMMCFAWFVWEIGYTGDPRIRWITND